MTKIWTVHSGDFTGDRILDLCASRTGASNGWQIHCGMSQGDGTFAMHSLATLDASMTSADWKMHPADYTSDGLVDLCASLVDSEGWQVRCAMSQGHGTFIVQNAQATHLGLPSRAPPRAIARLDAFMQPA